MEIHVNYSDKKYNTGNYLTKKTYLLKVKPFYYINDLT